MLGIQASGSSETRADMMTPGPRWPLWEGWPLEDSLTSWFLLSTSPDRQVDNWVAGAVLSQTSWLRAAMHGRHSCKVSSGRDPTLVKLSAVVLHQNQRLLSESHVVAGTYFYNWSRERDYFRCVEALAWVNGQESVVVVRSLRSD